MLIELEKTAIPLPAPEMDADHLFQLGVMYSTGQGGAPVDLISAHIMFNLASLRGSAEAAAYRKELSREMCREDVAEAQKAARCWLDQGRTKCAA
jgi:TPR repeat protein